MFPLERNFHLCNVQHPSTGLIYKQIFIQRNWCGVFWCSLIAKKKKKSQSITDLLLLISSTKMPATERERREEESGRLNFSLAGWDGRRGGGERGKEKGRREKGNNRYFWKGERKCVSGWYLFFFSPSPSPPPKKNHSGMGRRRIPWVRTGDGRKAQHT